MNKATRLSDLYAALVQEYTKTPGEWKGRLSCVARFYKRSFDNAVLIYAQRPNATQLGTFDEWHGKRIGRSINRGAKSIAVIDMVNPNASIKYLFDFLDTNGSVQSYRNLQKQLWELEEQYRPEVMVRLHEKYSLPVNSIEACLYRLVEQRVREMLPAYLEGFQVADEGSPLYGMPEAAVRAEFSTLVEESVAYMVFSKCGISTKRFDSGSFENIRSYNSLPLFMALGNCTVSIARPILGEVYQEIQNIKNERSKAYEDRTIDEPGIPIGQGRDDVSRTPDFDRHTDRPGISRTVRRTLEGLHDGGASAPPLRTGGTGENQRDDFAGGKGGSTAEGGADTTAPSHAADARDERYDGTGGASRHDNEGSGGERDKRSGTENQVAPQSPPPTQPPADGNKPSAGGFFVVPPRTQGQAAGKGNAQEGRENNTLIDAVLCADDLTPDAAGWLKDIVGFYQENDNPELRAHVLRIFYRGMNRNYGTKDGMYRVRILADEEKLTILERGNSSSYTYEELAGRVERLIRDGRFPFSGTEEQAGEPEKEKAPFAREEAGQKETGAVDSSGENTKNADQENKNREDTEPEGIDKKEIGGEYTDLNSTDGTIKEREGGSKRDTLPEENQAGQEPQGEYAPAGKILGQGRVDGRQISLFDREIQDGYEDVSGADGDAMLDGLAMSNEQAAVQGEAIPDTSSGQFQTKHPQVQPATDTQNYRFSESHHLYDGGPKTKCQNNIAAIRLLKELQAQSRMANAKEQITLAKFVGWGGLANALTPDKPGWENQYEDIKSLLTDEEFAAAQESSLTAYYTEQGIIRHIYDALSQFGFRGGNILDPAMATGNFFSVLPESMKNAKLYGVEIEPISGSIAKQLYPDADIQVAGFEHTPYPDQFFDLVIGNIPFNSIKVDDPKYNRYNFRIHDYFLAKSLDKLRPGGILAVITSKYTMDKANPTNRKYLAQRAELIGAIRLPNNAFRQVAGTEVTTDILFLQKREREIVPDENNSSWLSIEQDVDGILINRYFIDHPEMVLGKMVFDESMYGNEKTTACHPIPGDDLDERLGRAVSYLKGEYREPEQGESATEDDVPTPEDMPLPADPDVRNFSYTLVDNRLYYREHSRMYPQEITGKRAERIKGLVEITQTLRGLIDFQNQEQGTMSEAEYETTLKAHIANLNTVYDHFVKAYGYINSSANVTAFSQDANAPLLRSIEKERRDEKGVYDKTAIFYRATIRPKNLPTAVFSAEEALKVSLNVKGRVDLEYMAGLYQKPDQRIATKEEIIAELGEQIYQNPVRYAGNPYAGWETAGEYLSGHVKDKLTEAILKAEEEPERFARNVEALKAVQPAPLTPAEIRFSLGTPWIPLEVYQDFMYETFKTQGWNRMGRNAVVLEYSKYSSTYFIANKGSEKKSVTVNQVYGTERMNAYEILEASLNLRFVEVRDKVEYTDPVTGEEKEKYVLNRKETIIAREKQAQLKAEFEQWLFAEPERGASLTRLYNDRFNNLRPREYDGRELVLPDLAEGIKLRKHQLDVVAHGLYGEGNLLMAHEVGAGKTYAAIVLTHEMKRLGKANKPLIAVPNHLVGQWSDAYLELYPNANLLVAGKRDFEKQNRRRFVSRIATGDYDCIIMAHSSFERIGMSRERQLASMQRELDAVTEAIREQKARGGDSWSLKQMQTFRKNLQFRFDQLFHAAKKDDVINFEELGVDALVVDEAHAYKNNFSYTKMRNVAGISSQSSQRAMDMHQKCQYINEISGGRNVIYLTGTPVSNSMSELYVMQKTLQPQELERRGVLMFDEWAGTFGKVTSSLEIRPEGNGYQMKNRFSQFHNLPELMGMFALVADIRTADMLDLPTPKLKTGAPQIIKSTCTPDQKYIVMELAERAEEIRSGKVDSSQDNFLKLTHEARLLSTDPRAIDAAIADDPDTKLNQCARNVAKIYHETAGEKLTQIIFCDQGTPKYDGSFNFYEATKEALTRQGVKPEEIAFIHDAKTDVQREQLFEKVRKGETRILMGSTEKMGTGTNVQQKLVALHHLDVPRRPADLTQRNGRILRQGNENEEVSIYNYITENTFDAYLWKILEQKQRYISQIMTGRSALRTCEDLDETVLQYAEFKALATSDPRVKEKMEVDNEINRLTVLKSSWQSGKNHLQQQVTRTYPEQIARQEKKVAIPRKSIFHNFANIRSIKQAIKHDFRNSTFGTRVFFMFFNQVDRQFS